MKRFIVVSLSLCFSTPSYASAADTDKGASGKDTKFNTGKYGVAGCGLGSLAFGNQKGPIQILAATLNGTFGNQTFGITTGTSNCVDGGGETAALDQVNFTKINYANLSNDASVGGGEFLDAYADLFGCDDIAKARFASVMKENHRAIFVSDASADSVVETVRDRLHEDVGLASQCHRI